MLAINLTALAPLLWTIGIVVIGTLVLLALDAVDQKRRRYDRMLHARQRRARRTAHVMRRMSEIRDQTAELMDRAEEEGWR